MSEYDDLPDGLTFKPLSTWPEGPDPDPYRSRTSSKFKTPLVDTTSLLQREVQMLGVSYWMPGRAIVELALAPEDFRRDGKPRVHARASHPGVVLSLPKTKHGSLRYATDEFDRWHDNLRAIALSLEALRKVDRYGVARRGEQYRGWLALGAGSGDVSRGQRIVVESCGGSIAAALKATHPDTREDGFDDGDYAAVLAYRDNARHVVLP